MEYLNEYIKKGAKFEIQKGEGTPEKYFGYFVSADSLGYFVSSVAFDNKELNFEKGEEIEPCIYTPMGIYSLTCDIIEKTEDGGWHITHPKSVRHSQRREFLRAKIEADISITVKDENGNTSNFKGKTIDICAGGVSVDMDFGISDSSDIDIEMCVLGRKITAKAKLAYSAPIAKWGRLLFHTALMLTNLEKEDVEYISSACLEYAKNNLYM